MPCGDVLVRRKRVLGVDEVSMDTYFDMWCEEVGGHVVVKDGKLLCVKVSG